MNGKKRVKKKHYMFEEKVYNNKQYEKKLNKKNVS